MTVVRCTECERHFDLDTNVEEVGWWEPIVCVDCCEAKRMGKTLGQEEEGYSSGTSGVLPQVRQGAEGVSHEEGDSVPRGSARMQDVPPCVPSESVTYGHDEAMESIRHIRLNSIPRNTGKQIDDLLAYITRLEAQNAELLKQMEAADEWWADKVENAEGYAEHLEALNSKYYDLLQAVRNLMLGGVSDGYRGTIFDYDDIGRVQDALNALSESDKK